MPRPTVAPMVLALGLALLAAGVAPAPLSWSWGRSSCLRAGLWIAQLIPGRGHVHEPLVEPSRRPAPGDGQGRRRRTHAEGMPGYRLRLAEEVHPISAGVKGGLLGGLLMPIPALLWGLLSGHGLWYPVNLLAGLVLPGVERMTVAELEQFRCRSCCCGLVIHVVNSVIFGLIYGVLMPTLPSLPRPLAWGGLALPMLWTALSFGLMGLVNPVLSKGVAWPWFIVSQFLFGFVAASTIALVRTLLAAARPGLVGGVAGGLAMPIPAVLWGLASGRGIWYPVEPARGDGPAGHGPAPGRPSWGSSIAGLVGHRLGDPRRDVAGLRRDLRPADAPVPADPLDRWPGEAC